MENGKANEPATNVVLMLAIAMSLGMWGLLYLGAASVWSRLVNHTDVAVEGHSIPHLASLADLPQVRLPSRTRAKTARKRRLGPTLAARVFNRSSSL
jgi:hypothetical protein